MLRLFMFSLAAGCLLCGCTGSNAPADAANETPATAPAAAVADADAVTPLASGPFGHYSDGDFRIPLHDALVIPAKQDEVAVLLTPTPLTAEEREAILAKPEWPGLPLLGKRTPDYPDRYPFVLVKLHHQGAAEAGNVRSFYIMASAIGEPNNTDNLNGFPSEEHRVERLELRDGRVSLKFAGRWGVGEKKREWAFDIRE